MDFEYSIPPAKSPEVRLRLVDSAAPLQDGATRAASLLSELRHMLENGCTLTTALDTLDEAAAALHALVRPSQPILARVAGSERLNLVPMLDQALNNAAELISQSNIVVLRRKFSRRIVRANRQDLAALLDDVIQCAATCCATAPGPRILRLRIHNDHRDHPSLIVEHSGHWTAPSRPLTCRVDGVEVIQDQARCTFVLAFLHRP